MPNPNPPQVISVLIPTLNEADCLSATIRVLHERADQPDQFEVIVADCRSTDGTTDVARAAGASVVEGSPCSRAEACNLAAQSACGDILFFLHADSRVPENWDLAVSKTLEDPSNVGGAFRFVLDGPQFGLRVVELINRVRYHLWPLYYGDQGIFCRHLAFKACGGIPSKGIMEDAAFCRQLLRLGALHLLPLSMRTSPRRFLSGGIFRVLGHDTWLFIRDLLHVSNAKYALSYQRHNVERNSRD